MKKAFTLIELLVVIAIIGSLSALFLPNFMAVREKARDTQRKFDLKQIQKAFELYKQDQPTEEYPTALPEVNSNFSSGGNVYMSKFPGDPNRTPSNYYYPVPDNVNLTYTLCACLENKADPDGTSGNCDDVSYTCGTNPKKYVVNQP